MLTFRKAGIEDYEQLSELASASEAHWGFPDTYMADFNTRYNVTVQYIQENICYVAEDGGNLVGFYGFSQRDADTAFVDYLYIAPASFGLGYGRVLWLQLIEDCAARGIKSLTLVTSPEARGFYLKMGAKEVGSTESSLMKGRVIPVFQYNLT